MVSIVSEKHVHYVQVFNGVPDQHTYKKHNLIYHFVVSEH